MPLHRKRHSYTNKDDSIQEQGEGWPSRSATPESPKRRRSGMRNGFLRRRSHPQSPSYSHFASNIRTSPEAGTHSMPAIREPIKWPVFIIVAIVVVLLILCFGLLPDTVFRVMLLSQMLLCRFPPFLANWVLLIPILLPMNVQSRMEVVLGLGMLSWLGHLDWTFAWNRIYLWSHNWQRRRDATLDP